MTTIKFRFIRDGGLRVRVPYGSVRIARRIIRLADEGGTIQAHDMRRISDEPRDHTATSMTAALGRIGAEIID